MSEFADKARPAELGDPATDRALTYRVHPDDEPMAPDARRVIKSDDYWWIVITARGTESMPRVLAPGRVADWPYTNHALASAAFRAEDEHRTLSVDYDLDGGHATCACGTSIVVDRRYDAAEWWREHRRQARNAVAQSGERGDLDVTAFKGGVS